MNKFIEKYKYEYKNKYLIISKIKTINNECKNGCRIKVDNNYIYIEAYNKNTILLAYELIKKEIKNLDINSKKIIKIEKINNNINNFNILDNENIIECIQTKPIIMNTNVLLNEKKEDPIYKILKNENLSNEEKKRKIEVVEEEEE